MTRVCVPYVCVNTVYGAAFDDFGSIGSDRSMPGNRGSTTVHGVMPPHYLHELPVEDEKRLEKIFQKLDLDGNGKIDVKDLSKALREVGVDKYYAEVSIISKFPITMRRRRRQHTIELRNAEITCDFRVRNVLVGKHGLTSVSLLFYTCLLEPFRSFQSNFL